MKSNINLNWLRTFEAAARLSGFSAAARELGLTLSDEFIVPICGQQTRSKISSVSDLLDFESVHIVGFDDHWSRYMKLILLLEQL